MDDPDGVALLAEEHWRRYLADRNASDLDMAIRLYDSLLWARADLVPQQVRNALIAAAEPDSDDLDDRAGYAAEVVAVVQAVDDPALLDQAITLLREVVTDTPVDHPRSGAHLSDLGLVLQLRHRRTSRLDDLDEALRMARRAVEVTPSADPDWPAMASNLAAGLIRRFKIAGDTADLDDAIAILRPAERAPGESGEWGLALQTLSDGLPRRPVGGTRRPRVTRRRRSCCRSWRPARRDGPAGKRSWRASTVAADGAACAILANQPGRAVTVTEQGRNVLWSQLLETRGDVAALRDAAPHLADRLAGIGSALEALDDRVTDVQQSDSADVPP